MRTDQNKEVLVAPIASRIKHRWPYPWTPYQNESSVAPPPAANLSVPSACFLILWVAPSGAAANVSVPQKGMSRQAASDAAVAAVMSVSGRCGVTPLMLACERGHPRVARLLIDLDTACVDKCDDEGESKLVLYLEP